MTVRLQTKPGFTTGAQVGVGAAMVGDTHHIMVSTTVDTITTTTLHMLGAGVVTDILTGAGSTQSSSVLKI